MPLASHVLSNLIRQDLSNEADTVQLNNSYSTFKALILMSPLQGGFPVPLRLAPHIPLPQPWYHSIGEATRSILWVSEIKFSRSRA